MFSTTTSRRPFQYELDAYKKRHLTPPPTRRRFGSLDDDSDLSDVADIAYHTRWEDGRLILIFMTIMYSGIVMMH